MAGTSTALDCAGLPADGAVSAAVEDRAEIFEMTQAAEEAVLRPRDAGAWPHALRAALAARIATLNGEDGLASRHAEDAGAFAALADPAQDGATEGLAHVVLFMDKVAAEPRNVVEADIAGLQTAGVADADIVRLAELNAFLAYQLRLIAGLRLMKEAEA